MISQIRAVNPFSVIVLTVSPLPIQSSFFKESVVAVDCVSKSSLRVGVEMVMHKGLENVFYWPSFEIVKWLSPHLSPVFGAGDAEHYRTISSDLVQLITDLFIESYFVPED